MLPGCAECQSWARELHRRRMTRPNPDAHCGGCGAPETLVFDEVGRFAGLLVALPEGQRTALTSGLIRALEVSGDDMPRDERIALRRLLIEINPD